MTQNGGMRFLLVLTLIASPALALACPQPLPDRSAERDRLLATVREAPDAAAAQRANNRMWEFWATAPDARAQQLLDDGIRHRGYGELEPALSTFDDLIAYCPDYAEGYNQRGFVLFIMGEYGRALTDLERAVARAPKHYAAMTGLALTLMQLGRMEAGQGVLRRALELNPWLPERRMLAETPGDEPDRTPETPPGEDI